MKIASTASPALSNLLASIQQEALETAAETKAEAAKGDRQAIQKLAREQAANNLQNIEPPAADAAGNTKTLDVRG